MNLISGSSAFEVVCNRNHRPITVDRNINLRRLLLNKTLRYRKTFTLPVILDWDNEPYCSASTVNHGPVMHKERRAKRPGKNEQIQPNRRQDLLTAWPLTPPRRMAGRIWIGQLWSIIYGSSEGTPTNNLRILITCCLLYAVELRATLLLFWNSILQIKSPSVRIDYWRDSRRK